LASGKRKRTRLDDIDDEERNVCGSPKRLRVQGPVHGSISWTEDELSLMEEAEAATKEEERKAQIPGHNAYQPVDGWHLGHLCGNPRFPPGWEFMYVTSFDEPVKRPSSEQVYINASTDC